MEQIKIEPDTETKYLVDEANKTDFKKEIEPLSLVDCLVKTEPQVSYGFHMIDFIFNNVLISS